MVILDDANIVDAVNATALPLGDPRRPGPGVLGSVMGMNTVTHCNALIDVLTKGAKLAWPSSPSWAGSRCRPRHTTTPFQSALLA
jgi:hypothetical protein